MLGLYPTYSIATKPEFEPHKNPYVIQDGPPNGSRKWQVGAARLAVETGKTRSQENAQKTRRFPVVHYTREDGVRSFYPRETGEQLQKYSAERQARKPYKAMESAGCDSRTAPWFPVKLI